MLSLNFAVSIEKSGDEAEIHQVTKRAFLNAPHTDHTEHFIVDALRRAGALTISQVAKADGDIIGHVAISPVTLTGGASGWFRLGPVSVLPDFQGLGIGSKMIQRALSALQDRKST